VCTYNYLRYILLNLRERNILEIFSLIVIRKNSSKNLTISNLILVPDWWRRFVLIPLAFFANLRNIKEITELRRKRNGFYFLSEKIKKLE